jgi:tetratricopeptide (TPR) repeat protein
MDEPLVAQLAGVDLVVYDAPANTLNRPSELVGRDPLVDEVSAALDLGRRVLLHGLGGNGKTSVAATVADRRLDAGNGPYAWLRVGQANEEAFLEAVLTQFATGAERERIRGDTGNRRLLATRSLLAGAGFGLLVLDDVWSGPALFSILNAAPQSMPVLVTSRTRFAISRARSGLDAAFEVGDLAPKDALRLLANHAGDERCQPLAEAEGLCKDLGYHAFAVEIAGCQLNHYGLRPAELRHDIHDAPDALPLPGHMIEEGRESVRRLLDRSYRALGQSDAETFKAFGAMPSPGASIELLTTYLGTDVASTRRAVRLLTDLSLARRSGESQFYTLHDLTFSYARGLASKQPSGGLRTIHAVRSFVETYMGDHELLDLDIENVLGAAALARDAEASALVSILSNLTAGGYIDKRGHGSGVLTLLDEAIEAARRSTGDSGDVLHQFLSKRGNAYVAEGDLREAIEAYQEALRRAPNSQRRAVLLAVIGKVLAESGEHDSAHTHFAEAYAVAEASQDHLAMLQVMVQHSIAAFRQRDFRLARQIASQGVELSRQHDEPASEASFLNNLGSAEFEIGVRASLDRHEEACTIAARIHDNELLALTHHTLGIDHHALEAFEKARDHLNEARRLYATLGHVENEARVKAMMCRFGYVD